MSGTEAAAARIHAYIGSFTSAGGQGITAASVDAATGALTATSATAAVADPSYLAVRPGGRVLYAVSETAEGAVAAFTAGDGTLTPLGSPAPVRGAGPTHLSLTADLERVLTANYGSGSVSVLPLRPDGSPGAAAEVLGHRGRGPDPDRQSGPHAHQVLPDPTGRWILGVDLGTDSVRVCALDPASGRLEVRGETALRPGTGPRHLAFHPAGGHVLVLCELEPVVAVCRWDARTGALQPVAELPVVPEGSRGDAYPSALVVAPDGRRAWAAVRGHDSIAVLDLARGPERARRTASVPCGGHWPRDLAADPRGRRLYAANERSGDVTWFDLDPGTGLPHRAGSLAVPAATCIVFG
ncbi:lactonase family protein [Streptomyces sp. NPDC048001]|uniref:lactonase family protein n=1 Tax=Streptomyces sp. NPDC048001 TaxID=3365498 RepID=UPI0037112758